MTEVDEWFSQPLEGVVHDVPTAMNQSVKELWVAALRSGIYKQGTGMPVMRSEDDRFDPFGVLCDLAVILEVTTWERIDGHWFVPPYSEGNHMPPNVVQWCGFEGMHPSQLVPEYYNGSRHPLYRLNDIFKLSFNEIADIIEAQY